ncbi:DNA polymerase III subunit alpha [Candidatus Saccharibacteria bacterium]|nr:DNA polymerase III subunit alpha [Candidatus Saccharibacteria bacterium]MCL1963361.1 DNA polymerase III subunit alpha [Candidatus Saccharibacteria bacterium]
MVRITKAQKEADERMRREVSDQYLNKEKSATEYVAKNADFTPILPSERGKLKRDFAPRDFVHLHNHTNHSVLDGLTKIPELVKLIKEFGSDAVAMTDHGTLSGWVEFYKKAKSEDIKPILGIETYVAARSRTDRDPAKDKMRYHLTLLAHNDQGIKNLMKLSTVANLEGVYYKPRIDHELLEQFNEGIIALSGCASGEIGENLRAGDYEKAKEIATWYKSIFGNRYFIEIQDHGHLDAPKRWDLQTKINENALKIADELQIPAVVTCDAHYARVDDTDAHEILLCVGTGSFLSDKNRMSLSDFHLHVTDPAEIIGRWGKDYPDLIANTRLIADICNTEFKMGEYLIPKFPCPDGEDEKTYLDKLVYRGLAWRYGAAPQNNELTIEHVKKLLPAHILERTEYELSVVDRMGFNGYFLIVQDFINWGKRQGIVFGPGRGSAAGSIIAYAIRITELDPLKYDLLFERFLNPDRISMPDVDIDIQDTRRGEVVQYCTEKYGAARVSNIATFGTMASRAAVKDVARVLEVPFDEANRLSKLVPEPNQGHHVPLETAIKVDQDFKNEYETNPTSKRVIDFAIRLEGTIRSHGVHAAGVVIAPDDLVKFVPLEMAQKGVVATQFPMGPVEDLGLLKMDFLGLSNLTIINNAIRIIRKVYKKEIDLSNLPMDDEATYKLFQNGETTGVFQFESAGMKRYLKELKPTVFDDIVAMVALYRPGPMQFIESFIRRKHGEEKITYLHPKMENSFRDTYGILIYQEQFMNVSKDMCGFTGGQADYLRKAVAKKKADMMAKIKPEFIDGALKHNPDVTRDTMELFWSQLEEFANYCFNKSHAACYALISYWTAYLKAHYPAAFMAALMTSDASNTDRLTIEISECNRMGINVLNPDVNESFVEFAIVPETNNIRFGLSAVKGVGTTAIDVIMTQRDISKFESVEDFARRCNAQTCNKKVWESLIKSGAFDSFAYTVEPVGSDDPQIRNDRSDLIFNVENIVAFAQKVQKEAANGQENLFALLGDDTVRGAETHLEIAPSPAKVSDKEQLDWERELLGLYISAHPLDKYDAYFREQTHNISKISSDHDGALAIIGGLLSKMRTIITRSGSKMAFAGIENKTGEIEVVIFPKIYETLAEGLDVGAVIQVSGRISGKDRDGNRIPDPSIIVDTINIISDKDMEDYRPSGIEMGDIDMNVKSKSRRSGGGKSFGSAPANPSPEPAKPKPARSEPVDYVPIEPDKPKKIYVQIKDPSDGAKLVKMKQIFSDFPGQNEVILVLGDRKTDAIRMPFTAAPVDELSTKIAEIYGAEAVVIK